MIRILLITIVVLICLYAVSGCGGRPSPGPMPPPVPPAPVPVDQDKAIRDAINAVRIAAGLRPLTADPRLATAARAHAADLARRGRLDHTGADGSNPWDRMGRAGYPWRTAGECIAENQSDASEVVANWIDSPPHRQIILGPYKNMGGAVAFGANGRLFWCADFATPK